MQYSFGLTTFSPSGKLGQLEYALKAVSGGATALGIKAVNGVVIATEKKAPSELVDESTLEKISRLTDQIGVVYAGMGPDSRVLVKRARKIGLQYFSVYKEQVPVAQLVRDTATVMQEFTQSGGVRPFGVSLLMAGYDDHGPQLYQVDPSGAYFAWKASAIGKNMANAKAFLEKRYSEDMELEDAIHTALLTLKVSATQCMSFSSFSPSTPASATSSGRSATRLDASRIACGMIASAPRTCQRIWAHARVSTVALTAGVPASSAGAFLCASFLQDGFEGELTGHNIEVGILGPDRKFKVLTPEQVQDYLHEAE